MTARYDVIGKTYARYRRPDPRIAAMIAEAIGDASRTVSVGSGTGAYEPVGTIGVEPSWTMIDQRPPEAAPVVRAVAESLPFADASFDVGLALLTVHHWSDPVLGLRELTRVSARQVIFSWVPVAYHKFWLLTDYIPELRELEKDMAAVELITQVLRATEVVSVPVPRDCTDGFCGAYWRRPHMYLDPDARAAISGLARLGPSIVEPAMERLARDLSNGTWHERHGHILEEDDIDLGYRLVIAEGAR